MAGPAAGASLNLLQLFAVPMALVEQAVPASVNEEIGEWALLAREMEEGVRRSVVGGWHSAADLPVRGIRALDALFQVMVEQVRQVHARVSQVDEQPARFMLQAWATVMAQGDYVQVHDHADAHWSVVYYVDAGDGDAPASGRISWVNPIGAHRALPGAEIVPTSFSCMPRTGLMVVFPGWLRHWVEPYRGERPRIAIAANIEVQPVRPAPT